MVIEAVAPGFIEPIVLFKLGVEPGDSVKPVSLKGAIKGLSKIEILQLFRSGRTGCSRRRSEYQNRQ
jgi:hypothetical protein